MEAMTLLTGNLRRKRVGYFFDVGDVLIFTTTTCFVRTESATAARPTRRRHRQFADSQGNCWGITFDRPVIPDYVPTFWTCVSNIFQTIDTEWDQTATETASYHAQECDPCSTTVTMLQFVVYSAMQENLISNKHSYSIESSCWNDKCLQRTVNSVLKTIRLK